jgi:streptogramin lyase
MSVNEPGYEAQSLSVQLGPGETRTADLTLKDTKRADVPGSDLRRLNANMTPGGRRTKPIVYVNRMEDIYPPGPGQELVKELCVGCHGDGSTWGRARTREDFVQGIEKMTETGPANNPYALALGRTPLGLKEKELIADYLVKNVGGDQPDRRLKIDPLVLDEDVASKAIYVAYDIPEDLPLQPTQGDRIGADMIEGTIEQRDGLALHHLQAAAISPIDGNIFFSSRVSNSVLRLNPRELDPVKRWTDYPVKGHPWVAISGMAIDSKGTVYWSELQGGKLGELDPVTGKQIRHTMPQMGCDVGVIVDKDDNVGFALIWGAQFGKLDAVTRKIHMYPTPTPDNGIYGLAVDQHGNLWGAGWQRGTITKWDAESQLVKEYKVQNAWGQIRRMGVDSKGIVWGSEYNVGLMARLDPQTGKLTEYKIPVSGARPYEAWPDKLDNAWTADQYHSTVIKLDAKSGKFTFYPMPQPNQSVPKMEVESNNTMWFGSRGVPSVVGVHFYPDGYTAAAPPLP